MEHIFDYVKDRYGNNFLELYEGNPHDMKKNSCGVCGNPCKIKYCSKSCAMKGNHYKNIGSPSQNRTDAADVKNRDPHH